MGLPARASARAARQHDNLPAVCWHSGSQPPAPDSRAARVPAAHLHCIVTLHMAGVLAAPGRAGIRFPEQLPTPTMNLVHRRLSSLPPHWHGEDTELCVGHWPGLSGRPVGQPGRAAHDAHRVASRFRGLSAGLVWYLAFSGFGFVSSSGLPVSLPPIFIQPTARDEGLGCELVGRQ